MSYSKAGGSYSDRDLEARYLNGAFVGATVGVNRSGSTIYGRIAAIVLRGHGVVVHLAGVSPDDEDHRLGLRLDEVVSINQDSPDTLLREELQEIRKALEGRRGR